MSAYLRVSFTSPSRFSEQKKYQRFSRKRLRASPTFSSSHLQIFTSAHLHIFSNIFCHLLIFLHVFSHISLILYLKPFSPQLIFSSSLTPLTSPFLTPTICTHICPSSQLLSHFLLHLLIFKARATLSHKMRVGRRKLRNNYDLLVLEHPFARNEGQSSKTAEKMRFYLS